MKKTYPNTWWRIALVAAVFILPSTVLADDTELFSTRANPNVLLMLDTTGSMDTKDPSVPSGSIGNLDGYGNSDSRLDILYKVTYNLLNADLSIPFTATSYQVSLQAAIQKNKVYSQIKVSCGGGWDSFPPPSGSGTFIASVAGPTEQFTYVSKTKSGKSCYLNLPSGTSFASDHVKTSIVKYSLATSYPTPYPLDHIQASGADYLNNLDNTDRKSVV